MAYAQLAGVPAQTAFYAAPAGLILYAIFGTSRQLVVAVSSAVAVMSASIIGGLAPADSETFIVMTAALAVMAGIVAVLAGLLRLGRIAQFFSESVLMGFVSGLALVIMIKQVPKLFGLEPVQGNFWERVIELIRELPETDLLTLAVGLSSLLLMIFLEHRYKRIPAALVILIYGIGVVSVFDLAAQGVEIIGEIPAGLAPPKIPDISLQDWATLIPGALAITLVMFSEAVGPDRSFARKHR
jgi:MFS superfamily sulfate permease-like transporter